MSREEGVNSREDGVMSIEEGVVMSGSLVRGRGWEFDRR